MILDAAKAAVVVTVAALLQVVLVNAFELLEGRADMLLLVLVSIALLRGPIYGAACGFWAGLLVDVSTLGTLGLTSLLLTGAGYLAGRVGDATSNHEHQKTRILITVVLVTVAVQLASAVVHLLLGESVSVGTVLGRVLVPTLILNAALAIPAYVAARKLLPPPPRRERIKEVAVV